METCPVLPGQEARAWHVLRKALYEKPGSAAWFPRWRLAFAGGTAFGVALVCAVILLRPSHAVATADSQVPGIYATAFYSPTAKAQVVWLNGLEPASDKPTYLDPTSPVGEKTDSAPPARTDDPNSL